MSVNWEQLLADCVDFTQRLIQTPSMTYEEEHIAQLVVAELEMLGFDQVWMDEIGNVNGRIQGTDPSLGAIVLNTHLDHVDPGEPNLWSVPPFSGSIVDERIIGRGAADIKGPLAVQIYSMAALLREGQRPQRDVVFSGVVQEEVGGGGAEFWVKHLDYAVDLLILGEPSDNKLALGHRGVLQMWLQFNGRSVHASVPERAQNLNYALAQFLQRLEKYKDQLKSHPMLGPTTVSPTIIEVDTKSPNVTPAWTRVLLDFRTGSESVNSLQDFVAQLASDWTHTISNAWETPAIPFVASDEIITGFYTPPDDPKVRKVQAILSQEIGYLAPLTSYKFATDGRHFVPYNITMVGYAPSEEDQAHVVDESISITKMGESLRGHYQILRQF